MVINMQNIVGLSNKDKNEIAAYIKASNLDDVNKSVRKVVPKNTFYTKVGKRIFDFLLALIAVLVTLPINLVIAVITIFDVGWPIFFMQKRIGMNKKAFYIVKFRNMTNAKSADGELLPPEERVTKWGKIARKTSLDELLNFLSILKGDMSFVGPRPILEDYAGLFSDFHLHRFDVRPGLECPSIKKLDHVMDWKERLDNDIWYVENCSLLTDIKLVFRIFELTIDRRATKIRGNASVGRIMGYTKDGDVISSHNVPDEFCEMFCKNHGYKDVQDAIQSRLKDTK